MATGLQPTNNLESAIIATLDPGSYTAILRGRNSTTGNGLVEVYDLEPSTELDTRLANISTRGFVQSGDNVMIGGVIIQGASRETSPRPRHWPEPGRLWRAKCAPRSDARCR